MSVATLVRPAAVTPAAPVRPVPSSGVVVATPEEMREAARQGRATGPALLEAAGAVRSAGAALAASAPEALSCAPLPALDLLADDLLVVVALGRALDDHLSRVAAGLEAADSGCLPGAARWPPPGTAELVGRTGGQSVAEELLTRATRAGALGLRGALGLSVLELALAHGRPLPRGVAAVAARTPLLALALAPVLAAEQTVREGTPYPDALTAGLAGVVAAAGAAALAGVAAAAVGIAATALPAVVAGLVVGAVAGWVTAEITGWWLARRRRERARRG